MVMDNLAKAEIYPLIIKRQICQIFKLILYNKKHPQVNQ